MAGKLTPPQIEIESVGDERTVRLIEGMAKRGYDMRPALRKIMDELQLEEREIYASSGHGEWADLADYTRRNKAYHGYPDQINVRTGLGRASLTERSAPKAIRRATLDKMVFGTRAKGPFFARYGTSYMPARNPLVDVDYVTRQRFVKDIKHYLLKGEMTGATFPR